MKTIATYALEVLAEKMADAADWLDCFYCDYIPNSTGQEKIELQTKYDHMLECLDVLGFSVKLAETKHTLEFCGLSVRTEDTEQ